MEFKPGDVVEIYDLAAADYDPDRDGVAEGHLECQAVMALSNWGGLPMRVIAINDPFVLAGPVDRKQRMIIDTRLVQLRRSSPGWIEHFTGDRTTRRTATG
jgi:hypothetical protein